MNRHPDEKPGPGPFRAIARLFRGPAARQTRPAEAPGPFADRPPSTIGKYEITREVGRGGMGIVYAARDKDLDRAVAIKVISRSGVAGAAADEDASRKRFLREARAAASVNHPNICQIYEIG